MLNDGVIEVMPAGPPARPPIKPFIEPLRDGLVVIVPEPLMLGMSKKLSGRSFEARMTLIRMPLS